MAVFYTDFLNGDDTTGDGSFATPYKTIFKATEVISANGDEVRAMGQTSTLLPGVNTLTFNNQYISTSVDLTSYFPDNHGYIRVIVPGGDDMYARVYNPSVSQLDMTAYTKSGLATGAYDIEVIPFTYFAGNAVTPVSPNGTGGYYEEVSSNVASYTDIKITGGWDTATTQNGYTSFVTRGSSYSNKYGTAAIKYTQNRGADLEFGNLDIVNMNGFIKDSNVSFSLSGWLRGIHCGTAFFGNSNFGIVGNKAATIPFLYSNYARMGDTTYSAGAPPADLAYPVIFDILIDAGNQSLYLSIPGNYNQAWNKNNPDDYYVQTRHAKYRYMNNTNYYTILNSASYGYKIETIEDVTANVPGATYVGQINSSSYANKIGNFIPNANGNKIICTGIGYNYPMNGLSTAGDGTVSIEDMSSSEGNYFNTLQHAGSVNNIMKPTILNSVEGIWYAYSEQYTQVLYRPNTTDFVTGVNSLEVLYVSAPTTGTLKINKMAQFQKWPSIEGSRTVTLKMKNLNLSQTAYTLSATYGNIFNSFADSQPAILSGSWIDYTLTINPATIADWDDNPLGFITVYIQTDSTVNGAHYLLDSITVS